VPERERVVVEVGGKRLEVSLPPGFGARPAAPHHATKAPPKRSGAKARTVVSGDALTSPMQGTIVKIAVEDGQAVAAGDLVVVLEAMKMEQPITAHKAGTVTGLVAELGQTVTSGAVLCELKD
jgi:acetyl-CoA/propionyl-CoA carboxylase biotin carboxyl carrier protein